MSYSVKHILYHAALRGVRTRFVNSISTLRPLRSAADSVTRRGSCWVLFSAALQTILHSALPLVPLFKGYYSYTCKLFFFTLGLGLRCSLKWCFSLLSSSFGRESLKSLSLCFSDIHTLWKVLHFQFRPRWTTPPGDDEGWNGQRPGADAGYPAG